MIAGVCACAGGHKSAEPPVPAAAATTPTAKPELATADDPADCSIVAAHFYNANVEAGMNPPTWVPDLVARHGLLDGWAYAAGACLAASNDAYELSSCCRRWTPTQHDRIGDDLAAKGVTLVLVTPHPSNQ